MKILISEIPDEGLELELKESLKLNDSFSPVKAQLKVKKVSTEILIKGDIESDIELQCSRCLKNFKNILNIPVDVIYHPVQELRDEDKHELKSEELNMGFYSGNELDLLDLLREQIMLNLPMKPLCDDLCKGICLMCGADLNEGSCSCNEREIDPRLQVLKKLRDKDS